MTSNDVHDNHDDDVHDGDRSTGGGTGGGAGSEGSAGAPPAAGVPVLRQVVLDTTDVRGLAEFYRELLGLAYRPGDEPPTDGTPDELGQDWLVLRASSGGPGIAFQQVARLPASTWPDDEVPQMLHLDTTVPSVADLEAAHQRALGLGATVLLDRSDDDEEPLWVYADPAGHPFCIFVAQPPR